MGDLGPQIGPRDVVDVALVASFAWLAIRYLRRTRARGSLLGLGLLAVVYALARWLELELTATLLQAFFAVVVLVLVVVFQDDLRRFFEQLGAMLARRGRVVPAGDAVDVLSRTVARMASQRIGALIVLPGRESLEPHLEGGIALGGRLSEPLLLSLFDTSSPGHDGAVIVRGDRVERFAAHLPLSADQLQLGPGGTRHAAALGLAERCDALCVVVSEERGTVSVARDGTLRVLTRPEQLQGELLAFRGRDAPARRRRWPSPSAWLEAVAALAFSMLLWWLWVPGAARVVARVEAPVVVENLPEGYVLDGVDPEDIRVTVSGRRRDLLLLTPDEVRVPIDGFLAKLGRRTFDVEPARITVPEGVKVEEVDPQRVKISVGNPPANEGGAPTQNGS